MISSLLYACTPEEVRMIMIDPKMLELSVYKDIPHLLLPVITDPEQANLALRWAVDEMERRYAVLSDAQVRDIGGYNKKLPQLLQEWEAERRALEEAADDARQAANEEGEEALAGSLLPGFAFDREGNQIDLFAGSAVVGEKPERMPYIVIIIDEFADLMMVASKEVEASVARIAAKARAAGIHLIVATQRPSVDVITGTIKNNFPSRIAFQVTSDIDSRTILDAKGRSSSWVWATCCTWTAAACRSGCTAASSRRMRSSRWWSSSRSRRGRCTTDRSRRSAMRRGRSSRRIAAPTRSTIRRCRSSRRPAR